jgi:hypothetical protein
MFQRSGHVEAIFLKPAISARQLGHQCAHSDTRVGFPFDMSARKSTGAPLSSTRSISPSDAFI